MTFLRSITLGTAAILFMSCHPENRCLRSKSDILAEQSRMRGTIIFQKGADGPFKEQGTVTGAFGNGVGIQSGEGSGRISASAEPTPGYFYEATSYINSKKEGFVIIRRVSQADLKMKAEQGAAANP